MKTLNLVIPCFNNALNVPKVIEPLEALSKKLLPHCQIIFTFVDDGSADATYSELQKLKLHFQNQAHLIKLTRNFGSSAAVVAGLADIEADCYAFMSVDLQDPPELLVDMVAHWEKGYKLVIANRMSRPEGFISRLYSSLYHAMMRKFIVHSAPPGGFDFMLFDKELRNLIVRHQEPNNFLPYQILWFGYPFVSLPYHRRPRTVGKSVWSFTKKLNALVDSLVGFSLLPMRVLTLGAIAIALLSIIYILFVICAILFQWEYIQPGWASLIVAVSFFSSCQLLGIGILAEYLWRNLEVSRKRPVFVIEKKE